MSADRTVYVLVYPSRVFAAHWSLWIPHHVNDNNGSVELHGSKLGDRIHVTGDRLNGYQYEYIRNYNPSADQRHPGLYAIGCVKNDDLSSYDSNDDPGLLLDSNRKEEQENGTISDIVVNKLDETCRMVEAPGPSLNPVVTTVSRGAAPPLGPPPTKKEVQDCQWWVRKAVAHLVQSGLLRSIEKSDQAKAPSAIVEKLPQH